MVSRPLQYPSILKSVVRLQFAVPFIPSSRTAYRPLTSSLHLNRDKNKFGSVSVEQTPTSAPPPISTPPVPLRKNPFRYLRYFRYFPYKTAVALILLLLIIDKIDSSLKEGIVAVLTQFTVPDNTWLYLNLNDLHITESPHSDRAIQLVPFVSSPGKRRMTVLELITTLNDAAQDPRVKGLILSFNESMIEHRAILTGDVVESHLGMAIYTDLHLAFQQFAAAKRIQRRDSKEPDVSKIESAKLGIGQPDSKYHPSQDIIVAISDSYTTSEYSLAASASRVFMQPSGTVQLVGLSMQQFFFGDILKKYGIDYKVESRRDYKSALANLTESKWNEKTRQNLEDLLWSLQTFTLSHIYARLSRGSDTPKVPPYGARIDPEIYPEFSALTAVQQSIREKQDTFREAVKNTFPILEAGPLKFDDAVNLGLIDGSGYHQELLASLGAIGIKTWSVRKYFDAIIAQGILDDIDTDKFVLPQLLGKRKKNVDDSKTAAKSKKEGEGDEKKPIPGSHVSVSLISTGPTPAFSESSVSLEVVVPRKIGLVYLDNAIEGKGRFGGEATAAYILKAARDPSISGIVLRINSPGGDAVASDTIHKAVLLAKQLKPVVASFGDVAASGGYYVAAGADKIFSGAYTITGSIGVILGWPVIKRLLQKLDVTSDEIKLTQNAAWQHPELGLPEQEMAKLSSMVDQGYEDFKGVVSSGRKMNVEDVEDVAQGQVYTGAQALHLGLVDEIGGLRDALVWTGALSLKQEGQEKDVKDWREVLDEESQKIFDDALEGGELIREAVKQAVASSPLFAGKPEPTDEEVGDVVNRLTVAVRPQIVTEIIPHVNLANEAFAVAISTAFQPDEERSPIPIDQPLALPDDDGTDSSVRRRMVMGALLGLARSNNIPIWQFPVFCLWYAGRATGKIGNSMIGGALDAWFGKLVKSQHAFENTMGSRSLFAGNANCVGIRMEMPPLKINF